MVQVKTTVFILGSGGFAHELLSYIQENFKSATKSKFGLLSDSEFYFVDDNNPDAITIEEYHNRVKGLKDPYYTIMGSGKCNIKVKMADEIVGPILSFTHPKSILLGKIGAGVVIAPGAVIAPMAIIKNHVLCNYNCTIGHNTVVGNYSVISPGAHIGGNCNIGNAVYVGAGATVRENINVGDGAVIGMNAIVTKDVPPQTTIIGVNERLNENV